MLLVYIPVAVFVQTFYMTFWLQALNTTLFTDIFIRFINGDSIADSVIISIFEGNPNAFFATSDVWVPFAIDLEQLNFPTPNDDDNNFEV